MEILFSFPTWSCVKRCHMVPRPVPRPCQCGIWYHDQCLSPGNSHMVPRSVYFTWQCVIWDNDQCILAICYTYNNHSISLGNVLCGTTTNAFLVAMCHAVSRPVQPSNVSCGTTNSVFHLTMCYTVPRPVSFTWPYVMRYHDQCNLAMCHTVPQPVYFTWQCAMRYHDQCLSPGNVLMRYHDQCNLAICLAEPQMKKLLRISWPRWAWKWTCSSSKDQAQASDQFLATTKLATNRAICFKIKKKLRAKCTLKDFQRPIINIFL